MGDASIWRVDTHAHKQGLDVILMLFQLLQVWKSAC